MKQKKNIDKIVLIIINFMIQIAQKEIETKTKIKTKIKKIYLIQIMLKQIYLIILMLKA